LRKSGKLSPSADSQVKNAFDQFQDLFSTYLVQEGPGNVFIKGL
jgi:hypothetical protein